MRKNNKGFSLVELLVVIAIIGVLTGIGVVSIRWIQGKPALQCAHMITSSLYESQSIAMAKYETAILIRRNADAKLELCQSYRETIDAEPVVTVTEIGNQDIEVTFTTESGAEYEISDTQYLTLYFNRTTGGCQPLEDINEYCTEISVAKGGTKKLIQIAPLTGNITLK